jgi:hypothetical protein
MKKQRKIPSFKKLTKFQKSFIRKKVKSLGNVVAVSRFYNLDDTVSKYALYVAQHRFDAPKRKKRRR